MRESFVYIADRQCDWYTYNFKKETFENNRGFDETLCALEDWDFVLRVSESSRIGFIPDVLVEAYQTEGSLSCDGAGYFHARCKMLASHYREMQEMDLFDDLVGNLFREAEKTWDIRICAKIIYEVSRILYGEEVLGSHI